MLAIAAFYDYEIWKVDVKTAFLNGFLEEELYMMQPEGFVDPKGANKMCKLQRSINGLVQASQSWNIRFDKLIKAYSFRKCYRAPTHFHVNTGFSKSLYKTKCFDHTIKAFIPTPRGLHQSING